MNFADCNSWWCRWLEALQSELVVQIGAAVVVTAAFFVLRWIWKNFIRPWLDKIKELEAKVRRLRAQIRALQKRLDRGLNAVKRVDQGAHKSEGNGLWLTEPIEQPPNSAQYQLNIQNSIPITVFVTDKGGVAKTTNAVNLAGHYALQQMGVADSKPVLLLEVDYQGSTASMTASDDDRIRIGIDSEATKLVSGFLQPQNLLTAIRVQHADMVADLPLQVVPAYYDLARAENRIMIEWLFGEKPKDIRYQLAEILHHPLVQQKFSRVIIDAPPRLTTACIQALCAAKYVVVPTILDRLSGDAVGTFLDQVEGLKSAGVCPHIQYAGIIGYRPGASTAIVPAAEEAIRDALKNLGLDPELYIEEVTLVHNPLIAESAGVMIAVAKNSNAQPVQVVRQMFADLAAQIEARE